MKVAMTYGKKLLVALACAGFLGGCATPSSESDFGNSVRKMIEAQKYTPPGQTPQRLPALDGQKAENVVQQYRTEAAPQNPARQDMGGATSGSQ